MILIDLDFSCPKSLLLKYSS